MLFISPQKLFFFSRYLRFCFDFLVMQQNSLIRKVNFKLHGVTARLTINCNTHIAQYSRGKDNQKMEFGQIMECNMRNIFLEKSYTKCGVATSPRPFSEKLKLVVSKYTETMPQVTCFYLKTKRRLGLVSSFIFRIILKLGSHLSKKIALFTSFKAF